MWKMSHLFKFMFVLKENVWDVEEILSRRTIDKETSVRQGRKPVSRQTRQSYPTDLKEM